MTSNNFCSLVHKAGATLTIIQVNFLSKKHPKKTQLVPQPTGLAE